jgi:hypothetical protein
MAAKPEANFLQIENVHLDPKRTFAKYYRLVMLRGRPSSIFDIFGRNL